MIECPGNMKFAIFCLTAVLATVRAKIGFDIPNLFNLNLIGGRSAQQFILPHQFISPKQPSRPQYYSGGPQYYSGGPQYYSGGSQNHPGGSRNYQGGSQNNQGSSPIYQGPSQNDQDESQNNPGGYPGTSQFPLQQRELPFGQNGFIKVRNDRLLGTLQFIVEYNLNGNRMRQESGRILIGISKIIKIPARAEDITVTIQRIRLIKQPEFFFRQFKYPVIRCYESKYGTTATEIGC
ncbi:hypothetical protein V9T40_007774 [Parthenolecanium corni]|uniref:Uncharacterized protein n=1 Tax=Parthenolecanium corni TaxID=536013 RepID=A0AAN9Y4Z9_9HEMI